MCHFPDLWKGCAGVYPSPQPCSPAQVLNFQIIQFIVPCFGWNQRKSFPREHICLPFSFVALVFFHGIYFISWAAGTITLFFLVTNPIVRHRLVTCHFVIYCVLIVLICWCPCLLCSCSSVFVIIDCYFLLCWCKLYFPVVVAAENSPGIYNTFLSLSCERIFATLLIFILSVRVFYLNYMHSVSCMQRPEEGVLWNWSHRWL